MNTEPSGDTSTPASASTSASPNIPTPWRWLLVCAGLLGVLMLAVHLTLNVFLNAYLEQELKKAVHSSTGGSYVLEFENLNFHIFGRRAVMDSPVLRPDTAALGSNVPKHKPFRAAVTADRFLIRGINIGAILLGQKLQARQVLLSSPRIELAMAEPSSKTPKTKESLTLSDFKNLNRLLFKAFSTNLSAVEIGRFTIRDAGLTVTAAENHETLSLTDTDIELRDITIDSVSAASTRLLPARGLELQVRGFRWTPAGGPYSLHTGPVVISSANQSARIDSFRLTPQYSRHDFSRKAGHEIDRIEMHIPHISLQNLRIDSLLAGRGLYAGHFRLKGGVAEVFRDKNLPGAVNRETELFHTKLKDIIRPVTIDTVSLSDSKITYMEEYPAMPEPGTITFNKLNATIRRLSNETGSPTALPITMEVRTDIMNTGTLNAQFAFFTDSSRAAGYHTVTGSLKDFAVPELNKMLVPAAFVRAESGYIHQLTFDMQLTDKAATGELTFNYEDLNISIVDMTSENQAGSKGFKSFLANTFVIKKSNHGSSLRTGEIKFERDRQKSVFNFWWKSLLSGLKDTIGI